MPLSDRIFNFLKVELNDFLSNHQEEQTSKKTKQAPSQDKDWTDAFYDFFNGAEDNNAQQDQNKAQEQWQNRQQRKSRHYSSQQQEYAYQQKQQQQQQAQSSVDVESKYYDALEIKPGASIEEIKTAYRQVMKKYHPDRFASAPEKQQYAEQLAQKINEAYQYFKKKYKF